MGSKFPLSGSKTSCHLTSDDGKVQVPAMLHTKDMFEEVLKDLQEYTWNEKDFLLTSFPKNGKTTLVVNEGKIIWVHWSLNAFSRDTRTYFRYSFDVGDYDDAATRVSRLHYW